MLSSLKKSVASQQSHEKKLMTDMYQERRIVLDDYNLHGPESHEWLSSKSDRADRVQRKRRIQSGKAQSCLSEDQPILERKQSNYSKTDSSNASQSTPMEIGDI